MKKQELKAAFEAALKQAREVAAKAEAEGRSLTDEERSQVEEILAKASGLKDQVAKIEGDEDLMKSLDTIASQVDLRPDAVAEAPKAKGGSIGERFVNDPAFKGWLASFGGRIPDTAKGINSPAIAVAGGLKTLITSADPDAQAGTLVQSDRRGLLDPAARRPLVLRSVITVGSTTSDSVEWVEEKAGTNNAATVAEATAVSGTSGTKPESAMEFEKKSTSVKTLAHWVPATKRALSDAAQIRTLIDAFLRDGLDQLLEDQIISGSGSGEDFEGILSNSDIQSQAYSSDILTTIRKAKTKVKTVGRAVANGILMHPDDVEALDLLQDNEDRFYAGGPFGGSDVPSVWRVPIVESEAITAGTALIGDWRKAVLLDREQATISVSDSHSDFFVRNMVAVLAEARAAFLVVRPSAFVEIDLTA